MGANQAAGGQWGLGAEPPALADFTIFQQTLRNFRHILAKISALKRDLIIDENGQVNRVGWGKV